MRPGNHDSGLIDCGSDRRLELPRFEDEIRCAARSDVPVLITGDPEEGREIACAIDRRSRTPRGTVEVVDCRQRGAFTRVMSDAPFSRPSQKGARAPILLLQEVYALSPNEQAEIDGRLAELRASSRAAAPRIMASSSSPLFERVQEGSFDERLYYRLNVIHMVL
jgi:DNA-binding NtrC family response regulator